ncbi:MAG TPA: cytochrome P450 [Solirubrobacterales bacterium]|nr:cytochrome P450 [Solirubrobacterales bacterium]
MSALPTDGMTLEDVDLTDHERFAERVPHEMFAVLRREDPVHWQDEKDGRGFWAITRHADITAVAKDWRTFSSERGGSSLQDLEPEELEARKSMLDMDPPPHNKLRAIVNRDFTPRAVRTFTERIRGMFDTVLDEALEKGEVEFVADVAAALPMRVFAELLGAPEGDHHYLVELGDRMLGQDDPEYALPPEVMEENRHLPFSNPAAQEMFEYGRKLADERRECPRDDIVTKLVEAEIEGCPLTQHEFDVYFLLLAVAGNETTRHSISSGVLALIENPDQFERLRSEPALMPLAANEILRWATPVHHFRRTATCDTELHGKTIRENDKLSTWYISGNFDEEVFDDPYSFDVGRDPNPQMTFGPGGPHFCTGAHLARLEIEIVFEEMVKRIAAFEPTGKAERLQSNFFNGIKRMPLRLVPA